MVGAGEEVGSLIKGGIGIGIGAGLGVLGEGVAVLAVEHLVLQVVGNALGHGCKVRLVAAAEAVIDRAILGGEQCIGGSQLGGGIEQDRQPRRMLHPDVLFPQTLGTNDFFLHGRLLSLLAPGQQVDNTQLGRLHILPDFLGGDRLGECDLIGGIGTAAALEDLIEQPGAHGAERIGD